MLQTPGTALKEETVEWPEWTWILQRLMHLAILLPGLLSSYYMNSTICFTQCTGEVGT